jgi:hypothetical protein
MVAPTPHTQEPGQSMLFFPFCGLDINFNSFLYVTYDHRVWKTGLPVRSAVLKSHIERSQILKSLPPLKK